MRITEYTGVLEIIQGDITGFEGHAVVNAANTRLAGGGGVDGAIHRVAGPELLQSCREIVQDRGELPPGEAVITPGYGLPASYVIHTVGPVWRGGEEGESRILARAYDACLRLASEQGLGSLAFPAISCGAYGFPERQAAGVALSAIKEGFARYGAFEVYMYLFSKQSYCIWAEEARKVFE